MASADNDSPEGVSFLTALLIRFKEVGSARLCRSERLLTMDFYVLRDLTDTEISDLEEQLKLHLEVFCQLQRKRPRHVLLRHGHGRLRPGALEELSGEEGLEVQSLTVERDLESICVQEISMLVSLIGDTFGRDLAANEDVPSEEPTIQEESFYRSLERVRSAAYETDLTGFRDDMRVLIYSSAEPLE